MNELNKQLVISTDKSKLNSETIIGFLAKSYWANQRPKNNILKSIETSDCVGAYIDDRQVGFARIVTDGVTMYWLCDVFVDEEYRGQGIGKRLVEYIITHDKYKDLYAILGTKDAHGLYEQYDFERDTNRFLARRPK